MIRSESYPNMTVCSMHVEDGDINSVCDDDDDDDGRDGSLRSKFRFLYYYGRSGIVNGSGSNSGCGEQCQGCYRRKCFMGFMLILLFLAFITITVFLIRR